MLLKTFKILPIFFVLYLVGGHLYYSQTGDFREGNILREAPIEVPQYDVPPELEELLAQTFTFFAHGNQTFAFESEDKTVVLKFFKKETLERSWVNNVVPPVFPFKRFLIRTGDENTAKMTRVFVGHQVAYEKNRDSSGLVYVRLNPEAPFEGVAEVVDWFGLTRKVDLSNAIFVVQVKARTTREVLQELLDEGRVEEAKKKIDQIYRLYSDEYGKGLVDHDHNVMINTGFVGDRAIRIDLGKLTKDERIFDPEFRRRDREKIDKRFHLWVRRYYPQYEGQISEQIGHTLGSCFLAWQCSRAK